MKRIGKVIHITRSGDLILRSDFAPRIGDPVYGPDLKRVGIIADVFGPVRAPYVAVRPLVDDPSRLVGRVLYVGRVRRWRRG